MPRGGDVIGRRASTLSCCRRRRRDVRCAAPRRPRALFNARPREIEYTQRAPLAFASATATQTTPEKKGEGHSGFLRALFETYRLHHLPPQKARRDPDSSSFHTTLPFNLPLTKPPTITAFCGDLVREPLRNAAARERERDGTAKITPRDPNNLSPPSLPFRSSPRDLWKPHRPVHAAAQSHSRSAHQPRPAARPQEQKRERESSKARTVDCRCRSCRAALGRLTRPAL